MPRPRVAACLAAPPCFAAAATKPDIVLIFADALKAAGYATGIFGKWHLDGEDGAAPGGQGFNTVFQSAGGWSKRQADDPKGIYSLARAACRFMEQNKDRPCFVHLPHFAIHTALQARASTLEKPKAKTPAQQHHNPLYAGCGHDLDHGVGILLGKLAVELYQLKDDIGERHDLAADPGHHAVLLGHRELL